MNTTNLRSDEIAKKLFLAGLYCLAILGLLEFDSSIAFAQSNQPTGTPRGSLGSFQGTLTPEPIVRPIRRETRPTEESKRNTIDWTTLPSTYTHDSTGQRVDQHSLGMDPVVIERADYTKSGYRHSRSSLQTGFSADHYHTVEQWGAEVRPYGEWRYPTRPFSVPYNVWGPQLPFAVGGGWAGGIPWNMQPGLIGNGAPLNANGNNAPLNGNPAGANGQPNPAFFPNNAGPNFGVGPANALRPMQDEYYPAAPIYYPPANGLR